PRSSWTQCSICVRVHSSVSFHRPFLMTSEESLTTQTAIQGGNMPKRQPVDLNSHLNANVTRGNPANFPVTLRPVFHDGPDGRSLIPARRAIVREDTGQAIAVVSDRYTLVPHVQILDLIERAIQPLDVGPVPRGIYVDHRGARMRAIFKFP